MATGSRFASWLRKWFGWYAAATNLEARRKVRRLLDVEPLEDRTVPAVLISYDQINRDVTFQGTVGSSDDVHLRAPNGVLEYSLDGVNFSRDLDALLPGEQSLSFVNNTVVRTDVGGTTYLGDRRGVGGTFFALSDLVVRDNAFISTAPPGAQADSLNLVIQSPDIRVGDGARIDGTAPDGFLSGDVSLLADTGYALTFTSSTAPFFKDRTAEAKIDVGAATIRGRNVNVRVVTDAKKYADFEVDAEALGRRLGGLVQAEMTNSPVLTFSEEDGDDTITRFAGSWIQDGFQPGMLIVIDGTINNDRVFRVSGVTDTVLTIDSRYSVNDETATGASVLHQVLAEQTGTPTLTFSEADNTITRSDGSWLLEGFAPGQRIHVHAPLFNGLPILNNGTYRLTAVTETTLTVDPNEDVLGDETIGATPGVVSQVYDGFPEAQLPLLTLDERGIPQDVAGELLSGDVFDSLVFANRPLRGLEGVVSVVQGVLSSSTSTLIVGAGAVLEAENDAVVSARALSDVTLKVPGLRIGNIFGPGSPLGIGYAQSDATARAVVESGARITAGNVASVRADVVNNMEAALKTFSGQILPTTPSSGGKQRYIGIPGPTFVLSYGQANSESEAAVEGGAVVQGGTVFVTATNNNDFLVDARGQIIQPRYNTGEGISVGISDVESSAVARVDGSVISPGNVTIEARSINLNNDVRGIARIRRGVLPDSAVTNAISSKGGGVKGTVGNLTGTGGLVPQSFTMAVGFALALSENKADAHVGAGGFVRAGGALEVRARAEDNFTGQGIGAAEMPSAVSLAGAIYWGDYENSATAYLGDSAHVNARSVNVLAEAIVPNQITVDDDVLGAIDFFKNFDYNTPSFDTGVGLNQGSRSDVPTVDYVTPIASLIEQAQYGGDTLGTLGERLSPFVGYVFNLGIQDKIATSYTQASAKGKAIDDKGRDPNQNLFSFAGSINLTQLDNEATAFIGAGAVVNEEELAEDGQWVNVAAVADVESINIAGMSTIFAIFDLVRTDTAPGAKSDTGGLSGNVVVTLYDNAARAYIDDRAEVRARGDVRVTSEADVFLLSLAQAGAKGRDLFGLTGAIAYHSVNNTAEAHVEESARVRAGNDVVIDAETDFLAIDLSMAKGVGGTVAVGAVASINNFSTTTRAFVGDTDGTPTAGGEISAAGDVDIRAEGDEFVVSLSLANAIAKGGERTTTDDEGNELGKMDSVKQFFSKKNTLYAEETKKGAGVAISGDAAINLLTDHTEAFVRDGATVRADSDRDGVGDVNINADASSWLIGSTLALSLDRRLKGASLAGSFGYDQLDRTTAAYAENAQLSGRDINVVAESTDRHLTLSAGGAISDPRGTKNVGIFGSANLHVINSDTRASLGDNVQATAAREVNVRAENHTQILSVAGGVTIAGYGGVGAGVEVSVITNDAAATIGTNAVVDAGGNVLVSARNLTYVLGIGASLAVGRREFGLSGSGAYLVVDTDTTARIGDNATVTTPQNVRVDAEDRARLLAIGGAAAGGATVGVGASIGGLIITRDVEASVGSNARVTALGHGTAADDPGGDSDATNGLVVEATGEDSLVVAGISGALAWDDGVAAAVSVITVTIDSDVKAHIGSGAQINTDNDGASNAQSVSVRADHDTDIISIAGGWASA